MTQIQTFVHTSVTSDFGLSIAQIAEQVKTYGRFAAWLNGDVTRIKEVLEIVKANGVSPAFFAAYEKTEGYNSKWGWLNHTSVNGSPTTDATSVAKWVALQANTMTGSPAWIDYANYNDFVPQSIKDAGNLDFQNMSAGSIGRVVIAGTAAATWEVYYPNGLKKEYNGVQDYGAPITGMMNTITSWGGTISGGGGKPQYPTLPELPITSKYGYRGDIGVPGASHYHWAIDIGSGGNANNPIYATQTGTVRKAGTYSNGGIYVIIQHEGDPYWSRYLHLASYSVTVGQKVTKGEQIGIMGNTGIGSGIHLDFAISKNGTFGNGTDTIDPEKYLQMEFGGGGGVDPQPTGTTGTISNTIQPTNKYETQGALDGMTYYKVKSGDNLSSIASKHKVNMNEILKVQYTGIKNKNVLKVGEVLLLPNTSKPTPTPAKNKIYIVKSGDYLGKIAKNLKVSEKHLVTKNNLKNPDKIFVGQKLVY